FIFVELVVILLRHVGNRVLRSGHLRETLPVGAVLLRLRLPGTNLLGTPMLGVLVFSHLQDLREENLAAIVFVLLIDRLCILVVGEGRSTFEEKLFENRRRHVIGADSVVLVDDNVENLTVAIGANIVIGEMRT